MLLNESTSLDAQIISGWLEKQWKKWRARAPTEFSDKEPIIMIVSGSVPELDLDATFQQKNDIGEAVE